MTPSELNSALIQSNSGLATASAVYQVDQLTAQGVAPTEFFVGLLDILAGSTGAQRAHIWQVDSQGELEILARAVSQSEDRDGFTEIDRLVAEKAYGQSRVAYEFTRPHPDMPEHLQRCCIAAPLFDHEKCIAIVTLVVYLKEPLEVDEKMDVVYAVINRVRHVYLFDHFAESHQQLSKINKARVVTEGIGKYLELKPMVHETVNRLQKYLKADRVSLAFKYGNRCVVKGVSNQAVFDRRSKVIRQQERLAARVAQITEPIWQPDPDLELAPAMQAMVNRYFEASNANSMAILPVFAEKKRRDDKDNIADTIQLDEQRKVCVAVLVLEGMDQPLEKTKIVRRWSRVEGPVSSAIANVKKHDGLFLMPVWKRLGGFADFYRGHTSRKAWLITALVVATIGSLFVVPADFKLRGDGVIQPVERQHVFASTEGIVNSILFEDGQLVKQGDLLMEMDNPELLAQIAEIEGKLREQKKQLETLSMQRVTRAFETEQEHRELVRSAAAAEVRIEGMEKQLALLQKSAAQLTVSSPIDGQVVTWDTQLKLQDRPVNRGDRLVTVALPTGGWELELRVPDKRAGYMLKRWQQMQGSGEPMKVSFVLASDPTSVFEGTVSDVAPNSDVDDQENENVVRVRVRLTDQEFALIESAKPGTTVIGHVHCGRASIGYCKLYEFIDWTRRTWFRFVS